MPLFCGHCDHDMSNSTKKVRRPRKVFYVDPKTEKNVTDIIQYHPFKGTYIICSECQALNKKSNRPL